MPPRPLASVAARPRPLARCPAALALALLPACGCADADDGPDATTSTATTSTAAGTEAGFVQAPDAPAPECDPGRQDCPAGQKCTPYALLAECCVDTTRCVPVSGARGEGEACTRADDTDDCARGLFCLTEQSGGAGPGTCVALCDVGDPGSCGADHCVQFNDGVLPLCRAACDPLAQTCPQGQACYAVLTEQVFVCLTSSFAPGHGLAGEPCATISACRPGLLCAPAAELDVCPEDLCCTPLCPTGVEDCPAPLACEQVYDVAAFPEYAGVGYCRLPE